MGSFFEFDLFEFEIEKRNQVLTYEQSSFYCLGSFHSVFGKPREEQIKILREGCEINELGHLFSLYQNDLQCLSLLTLNWMFEWGIHDNQPFVVTKLVWHELCPLLEEKSSKLSRYLAENIHYIYSRQDLILTR